MRESYDWWKLEQDDSWTCDLHDDITTTDDVCPQCLIEHDEDPRAFLAKYLSYERAKKHRSKRLALSLT